MTVIQCQPKRTVRFYGALAKTLKRRTFQAVGLNSASEVMRCLLTNFPQLGGHMRERHYRVVMNGRAISKDELNDPVGDNHVIHIIPAICGSGGNAPLAGILTGTALVAGAFFLPFAAPFLAPLGVGLILQGVSELISPTPNDTEESTDPSARSYNFSGLQQTTREGVPVPVVYGDVVTGSVVLSVAVGTDANQDEELEPDFGAGAGNPNPDPNPVPGPDGGGNGLPAGWPGRAPNVVLADDMQDEYPGICWTFAHEVYIRQNPSCDIINLNYDTYILYTAEAPMPNAPLGAVYKANYFYRFFRIGSVNLEFYYGDDCNSRAGAQFTVTSIVDCEGETVNDSTGLPITGPIGDPPPRRWSTVGHRTWRRPSPNTWPLYPNAPVELIAEEVTQNPAFAGYNISLPNPVMSHRFLGTSYPYIGQ